MQENENQNNSLVMPDINESTPELPTPAGQPKTDDSKPENPLNNYFKEIGSAQTTPPQSSAASIDNQPIPAQPIPAQPVPIQQNPAIEKSKADDPELLAIKKAKQKQLIKWVVVVLNFAITAFLLYYYFYMSKK